MVEATLDKLIGDRACDSDSWYEQLRQRAIEMIAPGRKNRKKKTQDGRVLRAFNAAGW